MFLSRLEAPVVSDPSSTKFTYEDLACFPDDGKRHELVDGEHFVTPAPNRKHQVAVGNLHHAISSYLDEHPAGEVLLAPFDVVFSDLDVVEPDLLFVATQNLQRLTDKNAQGPPDLVIEVLSESTRKHDEVRKRKLYERYGVGEYWIVDPELEAIKIYRRTEKGFERAAELSKEAGDTLSTPLLPGLTIPLSDVFA